MAKSLDKGPSAIVPIRAPQSLRDEIKSVLVENETLSDLTRQLWTKEAAKRKRAKREAKK